MSSVLRGFAQTRARTLYGENGDDIFTYADLMTWAAEKNAAVNGSMITLDMNDVAFGEAFFDLYDEYGRGTDSSISLLDLGKKIYIGMPKGTGSELAGESQIVTLSLVKVLQGQNRDLVGYMVSATNINQAIEDATDGALDVGVGGGAV
jgi:hypothetical protein